MNDFWRNESGRGRGHVAVAAVIVVVAGTVVRALWRANAERVRRWLRVCWCWGSAARTVSPARSSDAVFVLLTNDLELELLPLKTKLLGLEGFLGSAALVFFGLCGENGFERFGIVFVHVNDILDAPVGCIDWGTGGGCYRVETRRG